MQIIQSLIAIDHSDLSLVLLILVQSCIDLSEWTHCIHGGWSTALKAIEVRRLFREDQPQKSADAPERNSVEKLDVAYCKSPSNYHFNLPLISQERETWFVFGRSWRGEFIFAGRSAYVLIYKPHIWSKFFNLSVPALFLQFSRVLAFIKNISNSGRLPLEVFEELR